MKRNEAAERERLEEELRAKEEQLTKTLSDKRQEEAAAASNAEIHAQLQEEIRKAKEAKEQHEE